MRAGRLQEAIEIQAQTASESTSGLPLNQWTTIANGRRRAEVKPLSGREYFASLERHADLTTRITIRYFTDVRAGMRVVHRGSWYDIVSPPLHSTDRMETVLMCNLLEERPL